MTKHVVIDGELTAEQLHEVSGGMKYEKGTNNPDVIDARGGQLIVWGVQLTFDVNGKCSSIGPAPK